MIKAIRNFSCNGVTKRKNEEITKEEKTKIKDFFTQLVNDGLIIEVIEPIKQVEPIKEVESKKESKK